MAGVMGGLLFNAAFGFYVVGLFHSGVAFLSRRDIFMKVANLSVGLAFAFHTAFLFYRGIEISFMPIIGLRESLAFFAWTVSLCFLIAHHRYRIRGLGLFLLPLVAAFMLSTVFIQASPIPEFFRSSWVYVHGTLLFLAYGMFFVTFIAALLYLLQERALKQKKLTTLYRQLPALSVLDDLFLKFLGAGFAFMSAGLVVGIIMAEHDWVTGWHRDPKVISAVTTWGIYLALLYMRLAVGWRGRRTAFLSMIGFVSVLFTFLGVSSLGGQHNF
jgi:cytochrome c-type biogenesis protein CcsB